VKWIVGTALGAVLGLSAPARAQLVPHDAVAGGADITMRLDDTVRKDADHWAAHLSFTVQPGIPAVELPACADLVEARVDGAVVRAPTRRVTVVDLPNDGEQHIIRLVLESTRYEQRFPCSYDPRLGTRVKTVDGLGEFHFPSARASEGGGKAVVFIPKGHDLKQPSALLVGLHPWNGGIWTYSAYAELLREANAKDVVLLMPSGLGNSLYTDHAEAEVLSAIDELSHALAIDPRRVSIWGASMGGAGATTIGFHHPDRFATITSFFGDSKYDLGTYVKAILHDEAGAHRVNALDVADSARNVPVWLIHGEADKVSPIAQSEMLAAALEKRGFSVRFDRVPEMGHSGALVAKFSAEVVDHAAEARTPEAPARVSFVSTGPYDGSIYGIRFVRDGLPGDASIDLERQSDGIHVKNARGVKALFLPRGAFGVDPSATPSIVKDDPKARTVDVHWDALPELPFAACLDSSAARSWPCPSSPSRRSR
jgi:pimeloyl-ACP methyl ester carboxylesterase